MKFLKTKDHPLVGLLQQYNKPCHTSGSGLMIHGGDGCGHSSNMHTCCWNHGSENDPLRRPGLARLGCASQVVLCSQWQPHKWIEGVSNAVES